MRVVFKMRIKLQFLFKYSFFYSIFIFWFLCAAWTRRILRIISVLIAHNVPVVYDVPALNASEGRACALGLHFGSCSSFPYQAADRRSARQKVRERQRPNGAEPPTGGEAYTVCYVQ